MTSEQQNPPLANNLKHPGLQLDPVLTGFLKAQQLRGPEFAAQSDILELSPVMQPHLLADGAPVAWEAEFHCRGLVRDAETGAINEADRFRFGIVFPPQYLRQVDPLRVVSALEPAGIWHPNILGPMCCIGHVPPGTELVDLLYQIFEIITWQNWAAHDGLNQEACQWARNHTDRVPLERRPLKRRVTATATNTATTAVTATTTESTLPATAAGTQTKG